MSLIDRVERARAAGAELFLSIHADALPEEQMRGASVFTLSNKASDGLAADVASDENSDDAFGRRAVQTCQINAESDLQM